MTFDSSPSFLASSAPRQSPGLGIPLFERREDLQELGIGSPREVLAGVPSSIGRPTGPEPVEHFDAAGAKFVEEAAIPHQQFDELRIGRVGIAARVAVDDGDAVGLSQRREHALELGHHGVDGLRIGRIDPSVDREEMAFFEGHSGRGRIDGRHVGALPDPHLHVEVVVGRIDHAADFFQVSPVARRQGIGHRFLHRPDQHEIEPQPVEPVQIAVPVVVGPGAPA